MEDSEIYEDAQSKIEIQSKSKTCSIYQDAQSKLINSNSKRNKSKKSESSVYEDAQSKITSNSIVYCHKKSLSKASKDNIEIENKNKNNFVYNKNIYKSENVKNNVDKKLISRNNINNNKEKNSQSLYEEPKGSENEETYKEQTLFEGSNRRGDCCNLPKCFIF